MSPRLESWKTILERLTRTDLTYLSGGSFWLFLNQAGAVLMGLISSVVFAHFVSAEQYGTYRFLLSIYGLLSIFTLPGVRTAMTRRVSQGQFNVLRYGIKTQMKAALVGSVISLAIAGWYAWHHNNLLAWGLLLISLFLPLTDTLDLGSYFQGKRSFKELFYYTGVVGLVSLLGSGIGIWLSGNPLILLTLFLGGISLTRASFLLWHHRALLARETKTAQERIDIAQFGLQLSLMNVFPLTANALDKILLFHFLSPVVVAQYTFATSLPNQLRGFMRNLGMLAFPKFSNRPAQEVYHGLIHRLPFLVIGISLLIGLYILIAPIIFPILFPQYASVVFLSQLFCLSIFDSVTFPINAALTAHKRTALLTTFTAMTYIVDLLLLFLLIPNWGLQGVVIAKLTSRGLAATLGVIILLRLTKSPSTTTS